MNVAANNRRKQVEDPHGTNPAQWLDLYGDFLFNFAVGQVRDASEAEDLVQETFLAALKSRDRFAGKSSERTWLTSILRHKIYDHLRVKSRRARIMDIGPDSHANMGDVDESFVWLDESVGQCLRPDRRIEWREFRAALE